MAPVDLLHHSVHGSLTGNIRSLRDIQLQRLTYPNTTICLVQVMDEHEVGHLLHHVQGIGNAVGLEDHPQTVNFVFQFAGNHDRFLLKLCPSLSQIYIAQYSPSSAVYHAGREKSNSVMVRRIRRKARSAFLRSFSSARCPAAPWL